MDISDSTAPRTDQQNFDNYLAGPKTVTVSEVKAGSAEQPVEIHLREFPGQPYKPSRSMRRVLLSAWGPDGSTYAGRKMTLYGDPTVKFGAAVVGGIKISALSHLDAPHTVSLTVSRGKRERFTVQPLASAPSRDWLKELELAGADVTALASLGAAAKTAGASEDTLTKIRDKYTAAKKGEL